VTPFVQRAERTEEGLVRLSLSDNAVSLLIFALETGHPNGLDTLLASYSSGVIREELEPYIIESAEALNIPPTDEMVEALLDSEMARLENFIKHGSERGPLMPLERDDIGICIEMTPDTFFMLSVSAGILIPDYMGPSEAFLIELNKASNILSEAEKIALMRAPESGPLN
jgi:hypothetical protein